MSAERTTAGVEAIELEAERILKEARSQANEILIKANEEANKILAADPALDRVEAECERIVQRAKQEADQQVEEAGIKAAGIKAGVSKKVAEVVMRAVNEITGMEPR